MPTYEYKCDACDFRFERFQPITAKPIRKCPNCGKSKVKRLISAGGGMIFKGSGFYITDYRDSKYKESAKADGGAQADKGEKGSKEEKGSAAAVKETASETKAAAPTKTTEAAPTKSESKEAKPAKSEKSGK